MTRLAQTHWLTEVLTEILSTVCTFVNTKIALNPPVGRWRCWCPDAPPTTTVTRSLPLLIQLGLRLRIGTRSAETHRD
jgi:hypothetical protein